MDSSEARVGFGVPHTADLPIYFVRSLMGLAKPSSGCRLIDVEGKGIDFARNEIVKGFLSDPDLTHLLFMDSDMEFAPETLRRLLDANTPVISGVYFARGDHPVPHVYRFVREDRYGQRWYHPMGEEFMKWLHEHPEAAGQPNAFCYPHQHFVEADAVGAGCLLVAREVFEAIPEPWFQNARGSAGGEDFHFCEQVKAAGYHLFVDFAVQCDHEVQRTFNGRREFEEAFGFDEENEYDFKRPLVVQVGERGEHTISPVEAVFRFPYDIEGYLTPEEGKSLYLLALDSPRDGTVVELGTYKGRSTACLAQAGRRIITVDHDQGEPDLAVIPTVHEDHLEGDYIGQAQANVARYAPMTDVQFWSWHTALAAELLDSKESVDLLFIDGAHDEESVTADFRAWEPHLAPEAKVAFHDSNFPGVRALLDELEKDWESIHQQDALLVLQKVRG